MSVETLGPAPIGAAAARPAAAAVPALKRRLRTLPWFRPPRPRSGTPERLATALGTHAARVGWPVPLQSARILGGAAGRAALREDPALASRPVWQARLSAAALAALPLMRAPAAAGGGIIQTSGEALVLCPRSLPFSVAGLARALTGAAGDVLPPNVVETLVDRVLWEVGVALAWEPVAAAAGPSPFLPLLDVYEEGLYPLDLRGDEALLWAPCA